MVKVLG